MRTFRRLAVTVAVAGVLLGSAAGVTSAATVHGQVAMAPVQDVTGGQTTVTTAPDLAETLIEHGIVPSGIVVSLTAAAARALDARFSTSLFGAGLEFGTATTLLNF
jgi:hypothetical protein